MLTSFFIAMMFFLLDKIKKPGANPGLAPISQKKRPWAALLDIVYITGVKNAIDFWILSTVDDAAFLGVPQCH